MKTILITGAEGQLGKCMQKIGENSPRYRFIYTSSRTLDITKEREVALFFEKARPDYCINCAAYTQVEQAEKAPEEAFMVNVEGAKYLAEACVKNQTTLFYISTDYVFDGKKAKPYTEADLPNPINEYGKSKWAGEKAIKAILDTHFIIRTSWLYSEFGKNFYTTIVSKIKEGGEVHITNEQTGTPTNANDLAVLLMKIISRGYKKYGTYHFCGNAIMTWYDFARAIAKENDKQGVLKIVRTKNYHTFAERPVYSALKSSEIQFNNEEPSA